MMFREEIERRLAKLVQEHGEWISTYLFLMEPEHGETKNFPIPD